MSKCLFDSRMILSKETLSWRNPKTIDVLISLDMPENLELKPNTLVYTPVYQVSDVYPELCKFLKVRKTVRAGRKLLDNVDCFSRIGLLEIKNYVRFLRENKEEIKKAWKNNRLVFNCHQGFSRSTAYALIAMYYLNLERDEDIVKSLLEKCSWAYPNMDIIREFDSYIELLKKQYYQIVPRPRKSLFKLTKKGIYNKYSYAEQLVRMHKFYIFDVNGIK